MTENVAAYRQGAIVTIAVTDGRTVSNTVHVPRGAGCLGIDWADVDAKYRALAPQAPMSEERRSSARIALIFTHQVHSP